MQSTLEHIPIIQTDTFQRLEFAIDNIATTAGLGIVKGPVGIGKTFALDQLETTFVGKGYDVLIATARVEAAKSIKMFLNDMLAQYGRQENQADNAVNSLRECILNPGNSIKRKPSIVIIDESQMLASNILETLRGLYDEGDAARRGESFKPAFGLMLVGNPQFLLRSGNEKQAKYSPLMDRVSMFLELDGPSADECIEFANSLVPNQPETAKLLAEIGIARGNFRGIEKGAMQARFLGGGTINIESVKKALFLLKGGKS